MEHYTKKLILLCFAILLSFSDRTFSQPENPKAVIKNNVSSSTKKNIPCDCGHDHDDADTDTDEDDEETAAHKALQERINFERKVANFEVDMLLPKGALNPYITVANNKNYPEAIKKSFEIFMNASVQSLVIHTKASNPLMPKSVRRDFLDKASSQLMNASQEATKLLYASTERPELRTHLLELAENVRFKEMYTKIFVQSPDLHTKVSILTNLLDCAANSWKFYTLVKSDLYKTKNQEEKDRINKEAFSWLYLPNMEQLKKEAEKATLHDIFTISILPILSAQWSPVKHAENLFSLKQLVCCAAQFYTMVKLTKEPALLRDAIADKTLRELTLPLGSNAIIKGSTGLFSLMKYFLKRQKYQKSYPLSAQKIAEIDKENILKKTTEAQKMMSNSLQEEQEPIRLTAQGITSPLLLKTFSEYLEKQRKENS